MDMTMPLVVKNLDDHPVTIGWDNHFVTIEPGSQRTASWEAVINFFGDPRAIENMFSEKSDSGIVGWVPDRKSEVRRLQCKWGNNFGMDESKIFGPTIEVYTLEGERVWTVLEDPDGHHASPVLIAANEQSTLREQIDRQQKQLDALMKLAESGETTLPTTDEVPTDDSPRPTRGGRLSGKAAQDDN